MSALNAHFQSKERHENKTKLLRGFSTRALHAGNQVDSVTGAVVTPISLATTFMQPSLGDSTGYEYSRCGNPTRHAFEQQVAALENAKHGIAFASGCACTATIVNMLKSGDHIISCDDVYGGTNRYFNKIAVPAMGMTVSMIDMTVAGLLESTFNENPRTKLIWVESPTNPTLKLADIRKIAAFAKENKLLFVVDNTFMSPYFQNPLALGADVVVHSVTKYISGHSDVVMGIVLCNSDALHEQLRFLQKSIGAVPSPFDCYMAMRGVKTLALRMEQHQKNAMEIALFLEKHPLVEKVIYPGLESHPQHALAKTQMSGFGGMVSFYLRVTKECKDACKREVDAFFSAVSIFSLAESLGAVESLCGYPTMMTHGDVSVEQKSALGITDNMIRLSGRKTAATTCI